MDGIPDDRLNCVIRYLSKSSLLIFAKDLIVVKISIIYFLDMSLYLLELLFLATLTVSLLSIGIWCTELLAARACPCGVS